jgi:selenocysteine lyase/cysteine desulfurase
MTEDDRAQVAAWRADTPGCAHRVHLNNAGAGLMPRSVAGALQDHITLEMETGGYEAADARRNEIAECYEQLARLCATRPDNIAITASATAAFVQAVSAFSWEPGDVLVTSRLDYTSYQIQYLALAERYGITVLHAPDLPEGGVDPDGVRRLLAQNPRCRFVSITWIPTHAGTIQDVAAVGEACEAAGVPYHVDACQAAGQLPIDVSVLRCDYLSATGRKFLRGPRGTGWLYVSDRALARGDRPLHIDMRGAQWTAPREYTPASGARRFEEWEFAYSLVLGLGEAARYANAAGVDACGQRARSLAAYARERIAALPGTRVLDRGRDLSAIATVAFEGRDGGSVARALAEQRINAVSSLRWFGLLDFGDRGVESAVRISPHYYNTEEEIDTLADTLEALLAPVPAATASSSTGRRPGSRT